MDLACYVPHIIVTNTISNCDVFTLKRLVTFIELMIENQSLALLHKEHATIKILTKHCQFRDKHVLKNVHEACSAHKVMYRDAHVLFDFNCDSYANFM